MGLIVGARYGYDEKNEGQQIKLHEILLINST
jgi:hypothetical protein